MMVIDNNKKEELTCKVSPLVSKIKFVGTLSCLSDLCTRHYDKKKKMAHTFIHLSFVRVGLQEP